MASTTIYLIIEPTWSQYQPSKVNGMRVTKMLTKRPKTIAGVCVALTVRIPDAAFKPLEPTVIIDVPEAALAFEPSVSVVMPSDASQS